MSSVFFDIDLAEFWEPSESALPTYVGAPLTDEVVAAVERALGDRLPTSDLALMRVQNGRIPRRTRHRTREPTSWAVDHIAITGIDSIGHEPSCSLCGMTGSEFSIREWGYPPIGVYFAAAPRRTLTHRPRCPAPHLLPPRCYPRPRDRHAPPLDR